MKKIISMLCIIMLFFSLVGCGEVKQDIGKSKKFSEEEIQNAIDCTKTYFLMIAVFKKYGMTKKIQIEI